MKTPHPHPLAAEIVEICRWMYQKGFTLSTEGNVSASLGPDRILTTPRGLHKGFLRPDQLVVTDLDGRRVSGDFPPSSELQLHLMVYHERPDVGAVVHAHPTMAIACSLAGISLTAGVVPEVITSLGAIPTAPYATPGTAEAAESVHTLIHQLIYLVDNFRIRPRHFAPSHKRHDAKGTNIITTFLNIYQSFDRRFFTRRQNIEKLEIFS